MTIAVAMQVLSRLGYKRPKGVFDCTSAARAGAARAQGGKSSWKGGIATVLGAIRGREYFPAIEPLPIDRSDLRAAGRLTLRWEGKIVTQHPASRSRTPGVRTALLLAASLALLGACAQLAAAPDGGAPANPSSSQAADGPQTAAWTMQ
jgi:hypothetical protein